MLIARIDEIDPELVIYTLEADRSLWSCGSEVLLVDNTIHDVTLAEQGMHYFMEVWVAQEVVEVWRRWSSTAEPTSDEKCEAVLYYAINDAYLPTKDME
jgi:hypothetical protein